MPYTLLPNSGQSLGQTRAAIRENFVKIQNSFDVNHNDFDAANTGMHKYVQIPNISPAGTIPPLQASTGVLYTKARDGFSQIAYNQDTEGVGRVIQLTAGNLGGTNNSTFGENNSNGWTFLPGNLILNYGAVAVSSTTSQTITFAYPFKAATVPFTVNFTPFKAGTTSPGDTYVFFVNTSTISNTSFDIINRSTHSYGFYWTAIGIAS